MKPFVLIAAIVAVVCFGAVGAVARETISVGTSVTLTFKSPDTFSGTVKAKKGCQKGRTVTLTFGKQKLRSDKSNDRGKYKIIFATHDTFGNYRAVASERKITQNDGDKLICKKSKRVAVEVP